MASTNALLLLLLAAVAVLGSHAADPDIASDYVVPEGATPHDGFFTFKGLHHALWAPPPTGIPLNVTRATQQEFPALTGQGVSIAVVQFGAGGVNPLHTHPRASEIVVVLQGRLDVGFVDSTTNKLFTQTLGTGDVFVIPKGMVHFQINRDPKRHAVALTAFGSANPGAVGLPMTLFGSGISPDVLAKSFKTDAHTIDLLSWVTIQD